MNNFLSNMCRLCGNFSDELIKIFNSDRSSIYSKKIENYLDIQVELGEKSWMWLGFCQVCGERLQQWDEFAGKVKIVDAFFSSLPDSGDIIVDSDPTQLPSLKVPEESQRLRNRKKKRRRKATIDAEKPDDETGIVDFEVDDSGIESNSLENSRKIRLTIRKITDDVSQVKYEEIDQDERCEENRAVVEGSADEMVVEGGSSDVIEQTSPSSLPEEYGSETEVQEVADVLDVPEQVEVVQHEKKKKKSETDLSNFLWECWYCKSVHASWNALLRHCKLTHNSPAKVECMCGQFLLCRSSVVKHFLKHTVGLKHKCDFKNCGKTFVRQSLLDAHLLSHLPKDKQPWLCCKCCRRFHSEYLLKQHERMHLPKEEKISFPCYVCDKKLCSKSAVTAHVRSVHLGERPFVCDQCGLSFTSKGILAEHLLVHSDVFNHHCQDCGKSFKTKYRLRIHMDTHLQTKYACTICGLTLNTRRTLRMHLLVHQERKSFSCDTCGKCFRRSKDLKNHRNLHTGNRPYFCPFCPRTFANGSNCRSHKRRMHPVELKQYEDGMLGKETIMVQLADVTDEPRVILQDDVLLEESSVNVTDDDLAIDKVTMDVITNEELSADFTLQSINPFQTSYPCIPTLAAGSFLYRQ